MFNYKCEILLRVIIIHCHNCHSFYSADIDCLKTRLATGSQCSLQLIKSSKIDHGLILLIYHLNEQVKVNWLLSLLGI